MTGSGGQWGGVLRDECEGKIGDLAVSVPAGTLIFDGESVENFEEK